jgi:hypothetical protein
MPRLRRHDVADRRWGFYVECDGWTLRTTPRADRFFRVSRHYSDGGHFPVLVAATLVHLGEAKPDDWTPKAEALERFPRLNPGQSELSAPALAELRRFAKRRLEDVGLPPADLAAFDAFVREQTPMEPFGEDERYLR